MEKLDKLFDAAANLLFVSEKNEVDFSSAIKSLEKANSNASRIGLDTRRAIRESAALTSNEIADSVSKQLLDKLEQAHVQAENAASRFEKASRYSVLKLSFIMVLMLVSVAACIWFLFIKNIPTINEINELRNEKSQLQSQISRLNQYGYITKCGGELCVSVDEKQRFTSSDEKVIYYVISPRDGKN